MKTKLLRLAGVLAATAPGPAPARQEERGGQRLRKDLLRQHYETHPQPHSH